MGFSPHLLFISTLVKVAKPPPESSWGKQERQAKTGRGKAAAAKKEKSFYDSDDNSKPKNKSGSDDSSDSESDSSSSSSSSSSDSEPQKPTKKTVVKSAKVVAKPKLSVQPVAKPKPVKKPVKAASSDSDSDSSTSDDEQAKPNQIKAKSGAKNQQKIAPPPIKSNLDLLLDLEDTPPSMPTPTLTPSFGGFLTPTTPSLPNPTAGNVVHGITVSAFIYVIWDY